NHKRRGGSAQKGRELPEPLRLGRHRRFGRYRVLSHVPPNARLSCAQPHLDNFLKQLTIKVMPQQIPEVLGGIERPKDERDFPLGAIQAPIQIPPSYVPDMSWFKRNYQGQTPACGPHSGSHFKAILDFWQTNAALKGRKNPRYGWIKLKDPNSPVCDHYDLSVGTDMRSIFKWLQQVGANDFEPLENDVTLPLGDYSSATALTPAMDQNASGSKIDSYAFTTTDYDSLCQAVYRNKAVLILAKV